MGSTTLVNIGDGHNSTVRELPANNVLQLIVKIINDIVIIEIKSHELMGKVIKFLLKRKREVLWLQQIAKVLQQAS